MSKVITFSRVFPAYHPRTGQLTNFVEKILNGLKIDFHHRAYAGLLNDLNCKDVDYLRMLAGFVFGGIDYKEDGIKFHTIRSGNRWKVGDKFSPRIWSGKPYRSKQIIIAPDIVITGLYHFQIGTGGEYLLNGKKLSFPDLYEIAKNDGFTYLDDFELWFTTKRGQTFDGQVICWNKNIEYKHKK